MRLGIRIAVLALALLLSVLINKVAGMGTEHTTLYSDMTGRTVLWVFSQLVVAAGIFALTLKPNMSRFMTRGQKAIVLVFAILVSAQLLIQSYASYQRADNLSYYHTGYAADSHGAAIVWFILGILVFIGGVVACLIRPRITGAEAKG